VNLRKDHYRLTGPPRVVVAFTRAAAAVRAPRTIRTVAAARGRRALRARAIVRAPRHPPVTVVFRKMVVFRTENEKKKTKTPDPERRITWLVDR